MENDLINAAERLLLLLTERGLTLSVAESCTGGLICHAITSVPGSSRSFKAGIVVYSMDAKLNLLGIDKAILNSFGVVSPETAKAMSEAVLAKTGADVSLSTTGNLGPDALEGKDVGLVYFAVSSSNGTSVKEKHFGNERYYNKYSAAIEGIEYLIEIAKSR